MSYYHNPAPRPRFGIDDIMNIIQAAACLAMVGVLLALLVVTQSLGNQFGQMADEGALNIAIDRIKQGPTRIALIYPANLVNLRPAYTANSLTNLPTPDAEMVATFDTEELLTWCADDGAQEHLVMTTWNAANVDDFQHKWWHRVWEVSRVMRPLHERCVAAAEELMLTHEDTSEAELAIMLHARHQHELATIAERVGN